MMTTHELSLYNDALINNLSLNVAMSVYFIDPEIENLKSIPFFAKYKKETRMPVDTDRPVCVISKIPRHPRDIHDITRQLAPDSVLIYVGDNSKALWHKSSIFTPRSLFNHQLETIFQEPIGKISPTKKFLYLLKLLPTSKLWSPYTLHIYKKTPAHIKFKEYYSKTGTKPRISRLIERGVNKFNNHPINDIYSKIVATLRLLPFVGNSTYKKNFPVQANYELPHSKIEVAFLVGQLAIGGVERVLLNIIQGLPKDKYKITIYTTTWNAHEWESQFKEFSDHIVHIPEILGHRWPQAYVKKYLSDDLVRLDPSIIFITNSSDGYAALPLITRHIQPKVVDLLHTYGTPLEKDAFLRISQPYDHFISRRIVISDFLRKYFIQHYPVDPQKIKTIYNGIPAISTPIEVLRNEGRALLKIKNNERAITFLGRLQPDKSPDRIVELAYSLREILKKNNIFFAIVGEGSMTKDLISRARELNVYNTEVRFYPFTTSPQAVAAASYYTIITSNLEGMPMSILESMQAGTPAIASSVGGVPEIINDENGYLVPLKEPLNEKDILDEFADVIKKALNASSSQYESMQFSAKQKIDSLFTHMPDDYEALFDSLVRASVED